MKNFGLNDLLDGAIIRDNEYIIRVQGNLLVNLMVFPAQCLRY